MNKIYNENAQIFLTNLINDFNKIFSYQIIIHINLFYLNLVYFKILNKFNKLNLFEP